MENPSSVLTEYIEPAVVLSGVVLFLDVLLEFVVSEFGLTGGGLVSGASSHSVSDSDSEDESDVAPLLLCLLESDRLRRPVPRNWG